MTKNQIEQLIGKSGIIETSGEFPKTIPGRITESDGKGNAWFVDNDDIPYAFRLKHIIRFKETEFLKD